MIRVVVKLVLIFVLVYAGVTVWYGRLEDTLRQDIRSHETAVQRQPRKTTKILRQRPDYRIIIERNIFQAVIGGEPGGDEHLEPTALKLSLMGTVSGTKRDARAIIVDEQKKKQDLYKIGDSVQGALIQSIERGKVILQVHGRREVLLLKERQGGSRPDRRQLPPEPSMRSLRSRLTGAGEERLVPRIQPRRRSRYRLPLSVREERGGVEKAAVPAADDSLPPESRDNGQVPDSGGFSNE
ncbi:hypothetical protein MNBD_DELTA04-1636 [hydrothermal vent metagenome]|uniref:Type II secretion system protein GspC N-terminal domain-containing protein n=1 Tax=hydrothermal vent metagenome TaxID=652676 RepID=A0A3B0VPA1_9ZZZZ